MKNLVELYKSLRNSKELFESEFFIGTTKIDLVPGHFIAIGAQAGNKMVLFLSYLICKLYKDIHPRILMIENQDSAITNFDYLFSTIHQKPVVSSYKSRISENDQNHSLLNAKLFLVKEYFGSWESLKQKLPTLLKQQRTNILLINSIDHLFLESRNIKKRKEQKVILQELKELSLEYNFIPIFTFKVLPSVIKNKPPRPEFKDIPKYYFIPSITHILLYHPSTYLFNYDIPQEKQRSLEIQIHHTSNIQSGSFLLDVDKTHSYLQNLRDSANLLVQVDK